MRYRHELQIAREAAQAAGEVQVSYLTRSKKVEIKNDASPVTIVDKKCEARIRSIIADVFPRDGFLGEESGAEPGVSGRRWIVDPLDGTRPYIRGIPTYSSLIALEDGGEIVVGVMHLAGMRETYWASRGAGAFCNAKRIHVSSTNSLAEAMGSIIGFVEHGRSAAGRKLLGLAREWNYCYGFMDAYTYASVAAGRIDVCVNLVDKPWDCAAARCLIREAGGMFSDVKGNDSIYNGSVIASNGALHDAVLSRFTSRSR